MCWEEILHSPMKTLLTFGILVLFIGCDSDTNPSTNSQNDAVGYDRFLPMKIGNYWAYSNSSYIYDTSLIVRIRDKVSIHGYEYFLFENEYPHVHPYPAKDTDFYRFAELDKLYTIINGRDSLYVDLSSKAPSSSGPYFPGLVWIWTIRDSSFIGAFDSARVIILRGPEPNFMTFAPNVGILEAPYEKTLAPPSRLIGAKVNDSIITWKK